MRACCSIKRDAIDQLLLAALRAREEAADAHSGPIVAEDESDAFRVAAQLGHSRSRVSMAAAPKCRVAARSWLR
jgi:hypothetical protein